MYKRPVYQDRVSASSAELMPKQNGGMRLQINSIFVHCLRFTLYKSIALLRTCRNIAAQMWFNNSLQTLYSSLTRSKKILIFLTVLLILLLYMWPHWVRWPTTSYVEDPMDLCLGSKLEAFRKNIDNFNAMTSRSDVIVEGTNNFLPYIGNGYIGSVIDGESPLYIKHGRALSLPINYYPITTIHLEGFPTKEAYVTDVYSGLAYKLQCFQSDTLCISVASQFYVHRQRTSVLVQEFRIQNPTDHPVTVEFRHIGVSDWQGSRSRTGKASTARNTEVDYKTVLGSVPLEDTPGFVVAAAVTHSRITDMITVKAGATIKRHVYTAIRYQEKSQSSSTLEEDLLGLADLAEEDLKAVLNVDPIMLRNSHSAVWNGLWSSGFSISLSRAVDALNGDKINMTMYYAMSHSGMATTDRDATSSLYYPERCYEGHHTLQNAKMWEPVRSAEALISQVKTWIITLEKQGCASMVKAGAEGVLQAMVLSFGALRFKNDHLEFGAHPKDLHRDYYFRRLNYGNNTHVNVSVVVGEDNKASLFVALDRNDKPYYACDAGCLDTPVKLTKELSRFPVKLTDPHTSILYITYDRMHMEELKDAIHVKDIQEAPAHEHHVMALHRHGHHYGGLPKLFWVSIGFLILVFHLFLFKLIFNEYCQSMDSRYHRGKYSL